MTDSSRAPRRDGFRSRARLSRMEFDRRKLEFPRGTGYGEIYPSRGIRPSFAALLLLVKIRVFSRHKQKSSEALWVPLVALVFALRELIIDAVLLHVCRVILRII